MKFRRRDVLKGLSSVGVGLLTHNLININTEEDLKALNKNYCHLSPEQLALEEDYWAQIKHAYTVSPTLLNLNNGGVSPQPLVVQEAVEHYNKLSNEAPSYYMWRILDKGREVIRTSLSNLAGVSPEEIAIHRNSSESIETVIFGLNLERGDEVILCKQDYPNMINAWKQRARRDGISLVFLDFKLPIDDKSAIIKAYSDAITSETKVVHVTHVINWMGQIMPVSEIGKIAQKKGIKVLVDGAHSFAHLDFKIPDLHCDYFGTSLHKWLCAPFGSGMLYVKKQNIADLYPLLAAPDSSSDDIRKFEHLGTRSFAIEQAIGQAIEFHNMIGIERKSERLHYLKDYWTSRALKNARVSIGTGLSKDQSGAIALLKIEGMEATEIGKILQNKFRIHTTSVKWEGIEGVRVTPNVYTLTKDLDRLVEAIDEMV